MQTEMHLETRSTSVAEVTVHKMFPEYAETKNETRKTGWLLPKKKNSFLWMWIWYLYWYPYKSPWTVTKYKLMTINGHLIVFICVIGNIRGRNSSLLATSLCVPFKWWKKQKIIWTLISQYLWQLHF